VINIWAWGFPSCAHPHLFATDRAVSGPFAHLCQPCWYLHSCVDVPRGHPVLWPVCIGFVKHQHALLTEAKAFIHVDRDHCLTTSCLTVALY
jgi:hypothetical protein